VLSVTILFALPQAASAQFDDLDQDPNAVLDQVGEEIHVGDQDIRVTILKIINVVLGFLGLLAVIITLYGGFVYMTSAGNQEKVLQARRILINGLIGVVIIMFSYTIVSFIINKLTDITNGSGSGGGTYTCTTPAGCNGGGIYPGGNCFDTVFIAKSITPNQNSTGMNNVSVRAVFTKGVAGNPEDVLSVRRGSIDFTEQLSFSYANSSGQYKNRVVEGVWATEDVNCGADAEGDDRCFPIDGAEYVVEIQDDVKSLDGASLETGTVCGGYEPPEQGRFKVMNNTDDDIKPSVGPITLVAKDGTVLGGTAVKVPKGNAYLVRSNIDDNSGVGYVHMEFKSSDDSGTYHWYDGPIDSDEVFDFAFDSLIVGSGFSEKKTYTINITAYDIDGNSTTQSLDFTVVGAHCGNGIQDEDETGVDVGGSCGGGIGDPCTTSKECSGDLVCGPGGTCVGYPIIKAVSPLEGAPGNWVTIQGNYFGSTKGGIDFSTSVDGDGQYSNWTSAPIAQCGVAGDSWDDTYVVAEVPTSFSSGEDANIRITVPAGTDDDLGEYLDGAAGFSDTNDQISVSHAGDLNPKDDSFTASVWVKHRKDISDASADTQQNLLIKHEFDSDPLARKRYSVSVKDGGGYAYYVLEDGQGGQISFTGDTPVAPNQWHHIVFVVDREQDVLRTYVNGAPDNKSGWPDLSGVGSVNPSAPLVLSGQPNSLEGYLDEVTLFDEALSGQVVDTLYDIGQGGSALDYKNVVLQHNPIAHWPLNEPAGDSIAHDTENNFHGTYQGVSQAQNGVFALNNIFILDGSDVVYTDDIQNDTGLQNLFTFNDIVRPGVCRAVLAEDFTISIDDTDVVYAAGSKKGPPEALLGIDGKGFGNSGNTDVFVGGKKAKQETLQSLFVSAFIPKNMNPGVVGVYVEVDGVESNGVPFTVVSGDEADATPQIDTISPDRTTGGSYISIQGSGFGEIAGEVYIAKTTAEVLLCGTAAEPGDSTCQSLNVTDFPSYCGKTWNNNQVIAEIPSVGDFGDYVLLLKNAAIQPTTGEDIFEIYDGPPLPSVCKLKPSSGPAPLADDSAGLRLRGVNFSDEPEVFFWRPGASIDDTNTWLSSVSHPLDDGSSVISDRSDTEVVTHIPYSKTHGYSMESGPIQVKADNGEMSNGVLYTVSDCRSAEPIPGFQCCEEGDDTGLWKSSSHTCAGQPRNAGYVWRFTTGLLPRIPEVGVSCVDVAPEGDGPLDTLSFPSPVPSIEWPDGTNACQNATIAVRFEDARGDVIAMDPDSVVGNVSVYTCGADEISLCAGIEDVKDLAADIDGVEEVVLDIDETTLATGLLYIKQAPPDLQENTWYHVEFGTGVKSADSLTPLGESIPGQPLRRDRPCREGTAFCYNFRVGSDFCEIKDINIHPSFYETNMLGLLAHPPGSQNPMYYFLWGEADRACTVLNVDGLGWDWNSESDTLATVVPAPDLLKDPPRYTDSRAKVTAENDAPDGVDIIADGDITKADGTSQYLDASSTLYIDLGDPRVIYREPECNESCINAGVRADFNRRMATSTYLEGFHIYQCPDLKDPNCAVEDEDKLTISPDELYVSSNEFSLQYEPSSYLIPNTRYKVVLTTDIKAIGGYDADGKIKAGGKSLEETVWYFKTKDDGTPCKASLVTVHPDPFTAFLIGEKTSYIATPRRSPNSCSKYGQALDRNSHSYEWSADLKDSKEVVDISNFKGGHDVAPYCTGKCLPAGSDIPRSVDVSQVIACGNGVVDVGEDCDIAELADDGSLLEEVGVSCTLECKRPGNSVSGGEGTPDVCGNGEVEWWKGELCDTKDDNTKDFCTNECTLLGAAASTEAGTCGDGIVAYNETCDTGLSVAEAVSGGFPVNYSRVGCKNNCLHEGTRPIASYCLADGVTTGVCEDRVSVCGNGVLEHGEECEIGVSGATADQCGPTCLLKDVCDYPSLKQCNAGDDGCKNDCTLAGSSLNHGEPSVCGDGVQGNGEFEGASIGDADYQCELGSFDVSGGSGPIQVATAIGEAESDDAGAQHTLINASIIDATLPIETNASYTLQCGYREFDVPSVDSDPATPDIYNSCPSNDENLRGAADNTCCFPRPVRTDEYPVDGTGFGGTLPACPNTNIEATFPGEIDRNTVFDNVMIVRGYVDPDPAFNCGDDNLNVTTLVNQTLAYGGGQGAGAPGSFWKQWWKGFSNYFVQLFGKDVHAGQQTDMVSAIDLWCRTNISMAPDVRYVFDNTASEEVIVESTVSLNIYDSLEESTVYGVVLLGGPDGIQNEKGVSIKHKDPAVTHRDDIWVFRTGDKACRLDDVVIDPDSQLFTAPDTPHNFHAQALSFAYGTPIEIVSTNQYGWEWNWGPKQNPVFAIPANIDDATNTPDMAIASKSVEGSLTAVARATVTKDTFAGANDIGKSIVGTTQLTAMFCERPWPAADGSAWAPYEDNVFNFSMHYCADAGRGGAENQHDDLPFLDEELVVINTVDPDDVSGVDPDAGDGIASLAVTGDLLKRSLFFNDKNDDVIGLQIFDNNSSQLTLEKWFKNKFPDASLPQLIQLDGYDVLTDGDNYYVGALNVRDTKNPTSELFHRIFNNVYIFSVNEDAEAGTREVLGDLMDSLLFNINFTDYGYCLALGGDMFSSPENYNDAYVCRSDFDCRDPEGVPLVVSSDEVLSGVCSNAKTKFFRDNERLRDVQQIQEGLGDASPPLQSGSFIPHYSTSRWNESWKNSLQIKAVDPLNEWTTCDGEAQTCYDESTRTFQCPEHMSIYEYHYDTVDGTYDLHMQMEYFQIESLVEQFFSPLIPNKEAFIMDRFCDPVQPYSSFVNECGDGVVGAGELCDPPGSGEFSTIGDIADEHGVCEFFTEELCTDGAADCAFYKDHDVDGVPTRSFAKDKHFCGWSDGTGIHDIIDLSKSDYDSNPAFEARFYCGGTSDCRDFTKTFQGKNVRVRKMNGTVIEYTPEEFKDFFNQNFNKFTCYTPPDPENWEQQQCLNAVITFEDVACPAGSYSTKVCGNDCKSFEYGMCKEVASCGNGITEVGEECDSGDFNGQYGYCSDNCQSFPGYCGDNTKQDEEFCDWSDPEWSLYDKDSAKSCAYDCKSVGGYCGDGIPQLDDGEECDDGNDDNLDGCSNECRNIGVECREAVPSYGKVGDTSLPSWKISGSNTLISILYVTDAEFEPFKALFEQADLVDEFPSHVPECVGITGDEFCAQFELTCNKVNVNIPFGQPDVPCDQTLSRDLDAFVEVQCNGVYDPPAEASATLLEDPVCGNGVKEDESTHPDAEPDAWEDCDLGEEENGEVCQTAYGPDGGCTYCSNTCKSIYVESDAQCGNGVIDYMGSNESGSLYEVCENTDDGLVVNDPTSPVSCGDNPENKGTILCNNTCDDFINTCKTCTLYTDGSKAIPRVAYVNPMIADGEEWPLNDQTSAVLYRVNSEPWPEDGSVSSQGNFVSGTLSYLGFSKIAYYGQEDPPHTLVAKDPTEYNNLLDDNSEYFHDDSRTLEADAVCDGSYALQFNVRRVYAQLNNIPLGGNTNGRDPILQLNEDQGDLFEYSVNGEETIVQHEYVYSPAVPTSTFRVVVRWDDDVADEKTFYGGIYAEDIAGPGGVGGPVPGPILRYTDADTSLCTNMVLNAQEYWRPAGSGCGDYEGIAFVHPQIGKNNNTNIQSFTLDLSDPGNDESVGFFVSALGARIGNDDFKWKDIYVDVYTQHPNDAPTYSVYKPTKTFHIVEAAGTSSNQSARFWHVFNIVKEENGDGAEEYMIKPVPKNADEVYSHGRITTDDCSLKQGIPGAIACPDLL